MTHRVAFVWQDATSYPQGERGNRPPTAWDLYLAPSTRVYLTKGHLHYPDTWVVRVISQWGPEEPFAYISPEEPLGLHQVDEAKYAALMHAWNYFTAVEDSAAAIRKEIQGCVRGGPNSA